MSFLDDIVGMGGNLSPIQGESLEDTIARSATLSELLNQIHTTNNRDNIEQEDDRLKKLVTANVDPNHPIPVVYGEAYVGGAITDAVMTAGNTVMWFCITICEKTGFIQSTSTPSQFTVTEVYWDGSKVFFDADRFTVSKLVSATGEVNEDVAGLIEIYLYGGNSSTPLNGGGVATGLMPNWGTEHVMRDLIFALVKVTYSEDKNVVGIGNLQFKVINTMREPGDVLYDYMTNTRYGAGINPQEINGL